MFFLKTNFKYETKWVISTKKKNVCRVSFVPFTKNKILTHSRSSSSVLASAVVVVVQLSLSLFFRQAFFSKLLIFKSIFLRLCIEKYFLNLFLMRVCVCLFVSECVLVVSSGVLRLFCFDLLIEIDFTLPFLCCESE